MAPTRKQRKEAREASKIKLAHPDRSGPTEATLLQLAQDRELFEKADRQKRRQHGNSQDAEEAEGDGEPLSPTTERVMDAILWSLSLSMLHFTLDVLVQHQYAVAISWPKIVTRTTQAFLVFLLLVYVLHPHPSSPVLLPRLPARFQTPLRQSIFFIAGVSAGCYLIHISNKYGYLAIMKRAPPLGCLWVWSVTELNLTLSVLSLACNLAFFYQGGYTIRG
ncbi:hypothetical protein F4779DRAFT_68319 [Xylariaceae sp. FL0662B]|nr:hypothetical protein F4779DRAFT_68319 [Xylariaceae sp. FL0662B]